MKNSTIETTSYAGIDYGRGQAVNRNVRTGFRYGVISSNRIAPEAFEDIASNGTNVDFQNFQQELNSMIENALHAALNNYLSDNSVKQVIAAAKDEASELAVDNFESNGDCTRYEYDSDGYKIQTASDGDMFIIESPFFTYAQFCSPCAPGACYLASPLSEPVEANKCYCLGKDWFDEFNPCPYPVYSVATGQIV